MPTGGFFVLILSALTTSLKLRGASAEVVARHPSPLRCGGTSLKNFKCTHNVCINNFWWS